MHAERQTRRIARIPDNDREKVADQLYATRRCRLSSARRFSQQVHTLIAAGYPALYVLTHEESRATRLLYEAARAVDFHFFTYSGVTGLQQPATQGGSTEEWRQMDPVAAIQFFTDYPANALLVMYDLHLAFHNHGVIRALRDFVAAADAPVQRHIVVTSPTLELPVELQKCLTVVELPLPDEEEIRSHLETVLDRLRAGVIHFRPPDSKTIDRIVSACKGLTLDEVERVLAKSWVMHRRLEPSVLLEEKRQLVRKTDVLEYIDTTVTFADVGGLDALKAWIDERRNAFSPAARRFGLPYPKGLLLLGVPGTGKSLSCKAVAGELGLPLVRLDMGRIFAGYIGSSEANMRRAMQVVEAIAPCVLWLDELEKGLSGAGSSHVSDAGTSARVFGTFLQWLSERTAPVFLMATGNDVRELGAHHPELFRKGRFDEIFFVDLPTVEERREIFRIHYERRRESQTVERRVRDIDVDRVLEVTDGFSGAEVEQVVVNGLYKAFHAGREPVTDDFVAAAEETRPLVATMREQIEALRAWVDGRARWASTAQAAGRTR